MFSSYLVLLAGCGTLVGCSSSSKSQKGGERQPCLPGLVCDPGLTCLSGVCVLTSTSPTADGGGITPIPATGGVITAAPAPNGQFTVPTAHPRLWWTPERLAAAREWVKSHPIEFDASDMEDEDYILPAVSYLLTDNKAHAKLAIDWALAQRIDPVNNQDQYRWFGEVAILIYDWCYNEFTEAQRQTMRDRWDGYVKSGNTREWGGPDMPESNYYWGYLRNSLEWGIASFGESAAAQGFIDDALITRWQRTFIPYAAKDAQGGVPPEGSQYGRYLFGYGGIPFTTITMHGRGIYDETLFYKQAVYALIYATPPTVTTRDGRQTWDMFLYSDDEQWAQGDSASNAAWGDTMQTLANICSNQRIGQHAQQWVNQVSSELSPWVAGAGSTATAASFDALPLDYFAPGSGFFYLRNRWGTGATVTLLQLGYPLQRADHQHDDCGSFQIWRSGRWLTRDDGGMSDATVRGYNGGASLPASRAPAHNVILFNGIGPAATMEKAKADVRRVESQARYAYAATDLSKAYLSTDSDVQNPPVANIIREYLYVRELDTLVSLDRLRASADKVEKAWLLHSETQPQLDASARRITLTNGDQTLDVRVLVPSTPTLRTVDEGGDFGQYRVEVVDTSANQDSYFLTVMALGTGASAVTATLAADTPTDPFTVTLANAGGTPKSVQVIFPKGAKTFTGGSIQFDQEAAIPLREGVEPITLTDVGPVWGAVAAP